MFTALQIAVELERFALDCTELASQYDMHKKSGGTAGKATSQLPGVPIFTLDDQWKDMEQRLLATILEFPNTIKRAQLFVDIWGDIEPEELLPVCSDQAAIQGYVGWELARDLRSNYKLPPMDTKAARWDFAATLKKERDAALAREEAEIEELRANASKS